LLHRQGHFRQRLDQSGWQHEEPVPWNAADHSWRYDVVGISGFVVPVYFLDADLPENAVGDRTLTHFLYGGMRTTGCARR
jgi:starch phosphorylase